MLNDQENSHLPVVNYHTLEALRSSMEDDCNEVFQAIYASIDSLINELSELPENSETATRLFHSIKSPASSLGAERLADLSGRYEQQAKQGDIETWPDWLTSCKETFRQYKDKLSEIEIVP